MARIIVGVGGGIAAYKSLELIRELTAAGHSVRVVATPAALRFVGESSFAALSGGPALVDPFGEDRLRGAFPGHQPPAHQPIDHLALAESASLLIVAPATADLIARLAHGLADDLLTLTALACRGRLLVAPAMNGAMWENPAVQENLATLRARGAVVVGPGRGRLASLGEEGWGRMAEPAEIAACAEAVLAGLPDLSGVRVVVSAGGTREPLDAVRYLGNRSSGRMGFALALAAAAAGADVQVVAANPAVAPPGGLQVAVVERAEELREALLAAFPAAQVVLMAAAVADFAPADPHPGKLKKEGRGELTLRLAPTKDILSLLAARRRPGQVLIGFAAEHGEGGLERARAKLARKGIDGIVYNDVSVAGIGFDAPENEVVVVTEAGERRLARAPKPAVAAGILTALCELCPNWPAPGGKPIDDRQRGSAPLK